MQSPSIPSAAKAALRGITYGTAEAVPLTLRGLIMGSPNGDGLIF